MKTRTLILRSTPLLAAAIALTGCTSTAAAPEPSRSGAAVSVSDVWVKAADAGMTGAFGTITNTGRADIALVSASTPAAGRTELHETVTGPTGQPAMRAKEGGFGIPAGGALALAPGGNHMMLMDLGAPLHAGDDVTVTLTFSDRSTLDVTARVKDFRGANERYSGDSGSASPSAGMGH